MSKPTVPGYPDLLLDYRFTCRPLAASGNSVPPDRRCWHAAAVSRRYVYISGGYSGFGYYGDLHIFDTETKEWLVHETDVTKPRYAHSCSVIGSQIFLYGGARERIYYKYFNSLPSDPSAYVSGTVRSIEPGTGTAGPTERAAHGSAVVDGKLYIFGGDAGKGVYYNDIFAYDPRDGKWSQLQAKGQIPSPRGWCSLCAVGHRLYVLFGTNGNDVYNDVFYYDLDKNLWVKPQVRGPEPHPRHSQGACVKGNCIYVFGGVGERKRQLLNDVWVYVTEAEMWVLASPADGCQQPLSRYGHSTVFTGSDMFVFGGCLLDPSGTRSYSNDILLINFELRPSLVGVQSSLPQDLRQLVNKDVFSDVTFLIEGKKVYAHRCILAARNSDFFQKMFLGPLRESTAREITIPDVHYTVFLGLLEYIYTGTVEALTQADKELERSAIASPRGTPSPVFQMAIELLEAAHMYNLQPLERLCCQHLVKNLTPDTALDVWQFAVEYSVGPLEEVCMQYMRSRNEPIPASAVEGLSPDLRTKLAPLILP